MLRDIRVAGSAYSYAKMQKQRRRLSCLIWSQVRTYYPMMQRARPMWHPPALLELFALVGSFLKAWIKKKKIARFGQPFLTEPGREMRDGLAAVFLPLRQSSVRDFSVSFWCGTISIRGGMPSQAPMLDARLDAFKEQSRGSLVRMKTGLAVISRPSLDDSSS